MHFKYMISLIIHFSDTAIYEYSGVTVQKGEYMKTKIW